MKGLLLRLSALDADAETAVRVISFFDGLIAAKVSPQTLVEETARLAECPAALVDTASGLSLRAAPTRHDTPRRPAADGPPDGNGGPGMTSSTSTSTVGPRPPSGVVSSGGVPGDAVAGGAVSDGVVSSGVMPGGGVPGGVVAGGVVSGRAGAGSDGVVSSGVVPGGLVSAGAGGVVREVAGVGWVWLGRGEVLPLDELVLERFAFAAKVLVDAVPRPGSGVEVVLSAEAGELERCRALRSLQVEPGERVHVLAVDGDVASDVLRGAHVVSLGRVSAVLARVLPERFPPGVRVGVGPALPALEAPASWRHARTALRFSGLGERVVHYDGLGALAVVAARMRDEDIAGVADVAALDRLAAEPNGAGTLAVLAAFCATGSARQAAARVHRHHSTIAARLAHAEERLGFSFSAPGGRRRLDLAVLLRHLRDNPE